jgi:hypothetical protein
MRHLFCRFRHIQMALCVALLGVGQVGCKSWIRPGVDNPIPLNTASPFVQGSAVLLPGADYHLVTVRTGPILSRQPDGQVIPGQDVLCSEPSPDWAIAFGTAMAGAASGGASGGPSGSISGSASTTEAITAMAGRTAGVVALRDGLYSACQAYANQLIGKDAYSLILSQYGNLLVALASGGGGGAASTPSTSSAPPPGVAVAVSTGVPGSANPSGTPPSSAASKGGDSQVAMMQQQAVQAMLVSCISYNDWSIPHAENQLLDKYCGSFMSQLGTLLPDLLKPAAATNQTSSGPKPAAARTRQTQSGPKSAAVSTVPVKDLQQILLQDGDYQGKIDGIYNKGEMDTAYQKYSAKHPIGPTQSQPR